MKILLIIVLSFILFGGLILNYFRSKIMKAFKNFETQNFESSNFTSRPKDDILFENNETVISKGEAGKKENEKRRSTF